MATDGADSFLTRLPQLFDDALQRLVRGTGFFQGDFLADIVLAMIIGLLFPFGRWVMDTLVYGPVGRWAIGFPGNKKSDDPPTLDQLARLKKFKESFYKVGVQVAFTLVLAVVGLGRPWVYDTKQLWSECMGLPCEAPISPGERFVYCLELGFYTQAIPMLFLWETKRKDRWEVLAHHIATIVLIAYSYYLNLTHVGVLVLVCHEANDIFLEAAKMCRYTNNEEGSTAFFVVFLLSWISTRVLAFPLIVIRSTLFESKARADELGLRLADIQPHYVILNAFLGFLYVLHIYWTYLILRIVVQRLTGGKLDDIREDEEEEEAPATIEAAQQPAASAATQGSSVKQRRPVRVVAS